MQLNKLHIFTLLASFATTGWLSAQDIHFTQYNMSPLTLNPGNTGRFEGSVRIGGIYRSQWTKILGNRQFETPSAFVDAPVIRGFRKKDWVGVGVMLFTDLRAGAGGLRHGGQKLNAAYHLALNKKGTTSLAIGFQWGRETFSLSDGYQFQDGFINDLGAPHNSAATYDETKSIQALIDNGGPVNFSTFAGGLVLTSRLNKTTDFNIGFSLFNPTTPRFQSLVVKDTSSVNPNPNQAQPFDQPRRAIAHGTFNIRTSDRMTISPSFLYQTMAKQDEIMVQALGGYLFDEQKDITLQAGVGYRLGDAVNLLAGARVKDLTVGLAYDVNTSGLSGDTRFRGGFELSANYIIRIYKKAVTKPKILCPRF
jgi:type IX secretion system PorP/SprF family membrane protein